MKWFQQPPNRPPMKQYSQNKVGPVNPDGKTTEEAKIDKAMKIARDANSRSITIQRYLEELRERVDNLSIQVNNLDIVRRGQQLD